MKPFILLLTLALLAGCAAQSATLINDKGEKRHCYKSATGAVSNIVAQREFNKCLNDAGAAGFKMEKAE